MQHYFFPLLDALSGLILAFDDETAFMTCVAKLQSPVFHFSEGSGHAEQYHAEAYSMLRLQPLHCSMISWQIPPLYVHPFAVIKGHSKPFLTVVQTIGITPFQKSQKKAGSDLFPASNRQVSKNWRNIIKRISLVNKKVDIFLYT
jgi:hypothetical protein